MSLIAAEQRSVLQATNVNVALSSGGRIVRDVSLELAPGEILGLVGESGSGKTTLARALLGYSARGTVITSGELRIGGTQLRMDESLRKYRGSMISYVPQDPGRALNPALRLVESFQDVYRAHRGENCDVKDLERRFADVGLPTTSEFLRRLPHQLSGGQQQRVCIAIALACRPQVIVLDEPTTGLDVVTQSKIIQQLARLRDEHSVSMIYVTHDLAVVSQIADRVSVMYNGRLVEGGPTAELLATPRHPYTRGLLASSPDHVVPHRLVAMAGVAPGVGEEPSGCAFAPRCPLSDDACTQQVPEPVAIGSGRTVRCLKSDSSERIELVPLTRIEATGPSHPPVLELSDVSIGYRNRRDVRTVASGISFKLHRQSCVALVGESGSGKTSIARAVAGLVAPSAGSIRLDGEDLPPLARGRSVDQRRRVQLVFQNPADALNPRRTVADQIARPARLLRGLRGHSLAAEVDRLLDAVRLPSRVQHRYPSELSGGERQRVAIARALAAGPEVLVCDEITSALDVSVQAAVLDLLSTLQREENLSLLFITHDLGVVAAVADHVLVLDSGHIAEHGPVDAVLRSPDDDYTRSLLNAAPSVSAVREPSEGVLLDVGEVS